MSGDFIMNFYHLDDKLSKLNMTLRCGLIIADNVDEDKMKNLPEYYKSNYVSDIYDDTYLRTVVGSDASNKIIFPPLFNHMFDNIAHPFVVCECNLTRTQLKPIGYFILAEYAHKFIKDYYGIDFYEIEEEKSPVELCYNGSFIC